MSRCTSIAAIITVLCFTTPLGAQVMTGNVSKPDSVQSAASATPDSASTPATSKASEAQSRTSLGPTRDGMIVGLRLRTNDAPMPAPSPGKNSENRALMIVGGAAFIVGAIIGGDAGTIIMIGGAGVGLYGLWQYLR